MKSIILSVILSAGYADVQGLAELPGFIDEPYVQEIARTGSYIHIYGRKTCGNTTRMIQYLKNARVPYKFYSVDDASVSKKLHGKMKSAGLDTSYYYLPVIDVNGKMAINPNPKSVHSFYNQ